MGKVILAIGLAAGAYYAYQTYAAKSLSYETDAKKRDSRAQSAEYFFRTVYYSCEYLIVSILVETYQLVKNIKDASTRIHQQIFCIIQLVFFYLSILIDNLCIFILAHDRIKIKR